MKPSNANAGGRFPQPERYSEVQDNQDAANQLAAQGLEYTKQTIMKHREEDAQLWELLTQVPRLGGIWPYVCFILNIILPGTGTMLSSCVSSDRSWSKTQMAVGFV